MNATPQHDDRWVTHPQLDQLEAEAWAAARNREDNTVTADEYPEATDFSRRPGLYYVHRDGSTISTLDHEYMPELARPERDIVRALAGYVVDSLEDPK
jgi:hypothetical protein